MALSERRARSVFLYMAGPMQFDSDRLLSVGAGETQILEGVAADDARNRGRDCSEHLEDMGFFAVARNHHRDPVRRFASGLNRLKLRHKFLSFDCHRRCESSFERARHAQ